MSFLTTIENAVHTTAAWFLKVLKKSQQDAPAVAQVADRVIPWAKMVIDGVMIAEGGAAALPEVNSVIDEVNKDLDIACAAIYDVGVTPTVSGTLKDVTNNLAALLAAGHIKNPGNVALIKNVIASLAALIG